MKGIKSLATESITDVHTVVVNGVNSRPLKSTHLRDIARKQCPADFFNK